MLAIGPSFQSRTDLPKRSFDAFFVLIAAAFVTSKLVRWGQGRRSGGQRGSGKRTESGRSWMGCRQWMGQELEKRFRRPGRFI